MLGLRFRPRKDAPDEVIKKEREQWLQQMLEHSQTLRKLIHSDQAGWKEFCGLVQNYIDCAKKRKAVTALDRATDAEIAQLKLLDHEIYILTWMLQVPQDFINGVEAEIKKANHDGE